MYKVELFKKDNINLNKLLEGKIIKKIEYSENIPLEDNSIRITFLDNSDFLVYTFLRIINNGQIILCSADYYFDKNFVENNFNNSIENTLIQDALIKVNKLIKNKVINNVKMNCYGDLSIEIGENILIETFFDTMENDKDYYIYYGEDKTYLRFCKSENQLTVIEEVHE